ASRCAERDLAPAEPRRRLSHNPKSRFHRYAMVIGSGVAAAGFTSSQCGPGGKGKFFLAAFSRGRNPSFIYLISRFPSRPFTARGGELAGCNVNPGFII